MEDDNEEFFIKLAKHFQKPAAEKYPIINATFQQNEDLLQSLLDVQSPDELTNENISPLWCACYVGSSSCLQILLDSGGDVNIADSVQQTPLFVATYQGSEDNVKLLLDNGASLYQRDYLNRTVLHAAADAGNSKIISVLLEFERDHPLPEGSFLTPLIAAQDNDGRTALHYAAVGNQCDCVDSLIAGGANVDAVDKNNSTPLHLASEIGHDYVVDILIDDGANMEAVDSLKRTALHIACTEGRGYCVDLLIANGAEIMVLDGKGLSPLHLAVLNGQTEIVKLLLDGAEVDSIDDDGNEVPFRNAARPNVRDTRQRTCMHAAAELGDVVLCELLHQRGTDIHMRDDEGRSPLHYCGMWSQAGCVDWFLIKGIDVDIRDNSDRTCLHYASYFGNYQVVHTLLRRSADVNASDSKGDTPLLCALHEYDNNDKSEIIQLLLEYGANLLQTNDYKRNAIHICSCTGDVDTIELLLEQSCNEDMNWNDTEGTTISELINQPDIYGLTSLHFAAANSQYDVLEYLIQHGGNANVLDNAGCTPLHWACRCGSIDCIDILINQFRVNATIRDKQGQSSLCVAAYTGAKDCIRSLLEVGLSPMDRDRVGRTPLHGACYNGHTVILNMFLGCNDIQLDYVCNMGRTALHRAAAKGHLEIVKILLTNEATVDVIDEKGTSPLMLAIYYGHREVAKYLIEHGADPMRKDKAGRSGDDYLARGLKKGHIVDPSSPPPIPEHPQKKKLELVDSLEFLPMDNLNSSMDDPIVVTNDIEPAEPVIEEPVTPGEEVEELVDSADVPVVEPELSEMLNNENVTEVKASEDIRVDEPVVEEPVTEDVQEESPVTEEKASEDIPVEEPAVEPVTEEKVQEGVPATEEKLPEVIAADEPVVEEPVTEEKVQEESPVTEENESMDIPIREDKAPEDIPETVSEAPIESKNEKVENPTEPVVGEPVLESTDVEEESESEEVVGETEETEKVGGQPITDEVEEESGEEVVPEATKQEEKENIKPVVEEPKKEEKEERDEEEESWVEKAIGEIKQPIITPQITRDVHIDPIVNDNPIGETPGEREAPPGVISRVVNIILSCCNPILFLFVNNRQE